ncbi:hypothetical protein CEXT_227021 [Caerostris extrusa]|uniref:Uncharacterized protein n=1 Tax=Caerostris extrusa TaxID=172846 RepID=A0AAV4XW08_CAEEX|nr:hypothetical protein CEXT_227021 [Caerostris extrusa]
MWGQPNVTQVSTKSPHFDAAASSRNNDRQPCTPQPPLRSPPTSSNRLVDPEKDFILYTPTSPSRLLFSVFALFPVFLRADFIYSVGASIKCIAYLVDLNHVSWIIATGCHRSLESSFSLSERRNRIQSTNPSSRCSAFCQQPWTLLSLLCDSSLINQQSLQQQR